MTDPNYIADDANPLAAATSAGRFSHESNGQSPLSGPKQGGRSGSTPDFA